MSWEKIKLGKLCTIEKGTTGIQKAIPGEYPMVVTSEERKSHNEYQIDDEAVVIPLVSSTGHGHKSLKRIHYQSGKFALGSILCAVIPKNKKQLSAEYLYRYLDLNKENELVSRMKGMANVTLPIKEIADIDIPVPPLSDQLLFIEKYKQTETHSEGLRNELLNQSDLLTQLRQSFLREAMQGKLVKQDPKDGHAKDLLEKIKAEKAKSGKKEKELPPIKPEEIPFEIPENWVWCKVGNISKSIVPNRDKPKTFSGEITWITQSNFSDNSFKLNYSLNGIGLTKEEVTQYNCRVMPVGSVIMSCVGQFDLVCLVEKEIVANQQLHCFVPFSSIEPMYLCYAIKLFSKLIEKEAIHTTIKYINKTKCESIMVPLPPYPEQLRIVEKLDKLLMLCDEMQQSIQTSREQNELLLQQVLKEALSG